MPNAPRVSHKHTMKDPSLEACIEELRELEHEKAPSRTIIALNRFYASLENYLCDRGLEHDSEGHWLARHWSYRSLEKLSERIEACKKRGAIDRSLLDYIDYELWPQLERQNQKLL